ncbi:GFA family protein [Mesorhizobium sp. M1312]|uniref:GFA family protein n=1 Tax=unclassified Mesorhizobium TaxID=325217 RepID=UPI003339209C
MASQKNVSSQNVSNRMLAGKCLCGAVQYAVADEFIYAANCHCSNCRRTTGSAFEPFAGIERERLSLTKGEDNLLIFGEETGHDTRCKTCGSLLYSVTLVDEPTIRAAQHIFVGSKAKWFTITDDLPQYEEHVVIAEGAD